MKPAALILVMLSFGFLLAGYGSTPEAAGDGFQPARPGKVFRFPEDHGAHKAFKTEWWYYNGHLEDSRGRPFGYQLTFFRVGFRPPGVRDPHGSRWRIGELYLAHLALTDVVQKRFQYREKAARGNLGLAGAETGRYRVWLEAWEAKEKGGVHFLKAGNAALGFSLRLIPDRPPIVHGLEGVSPKGSGPGRASHYYSLTRIPTEGQIRIDGETREVRGQSWMDHEFGSHQLEADQVGWDWFSLQIGADLDLMLYQIRHRDGRADPYSSGTVRRHPGEPVHLTGSDFSVRVLATWKSLRSGAVYPSAWEITVPRKDLIVRVTPRVADQELETLKSTRVTYWEGAVLLEGTWGGRPVQGRGYVELTGYDRRFRPKF